MPIGETEYGGAEYGGSNQNQSTNLTGTIAQNIKKEIVLNLNALVLAGVINSVFEIDLGKNPTEMVPSAGYPFAIVGMPSITSDYEDNVTNKRNYKFNVMVINSYNALSDKNEGIEGIIDGFLNQFDNNFTLAGIADATVLPIKVVAAPVSTGDNTFICFVATIEAQATFTITNPNP